MKIKYDPVLVPQVIKALENRRIIAIAAGPHHCLAIDSDGIPYSWGNGLSSLSLLLCPMAKLAVLLGNNGRLGHKVQQDEFTPRPIGSFLERVQVNLENLVLAAGGMTSFCTAAGGMLYSWGLRKLHGECEMYPHPFYDFEGWKVT